MKSIVVGAVLLVAATPAAAREWWFISQGKDLAMFADRTSIIKATTSYAHDKIWAATYRSKPGPQGNLSSRDLWAFECASRRIGIAAYTNYNASGESVSSYSAPGEYAIELQPAVPDSIGEALLDFACHADEGTGLPTFKVGDREYVQTSDMEQMARVVNGTIGPAKQAPKTRTNNRLPTGRPTVISAHHR